MCRRSGTGRGRRAVEKKDGHGKGNWGDKPDGTYKRKGQEGSEDKPVEQVEEVEEKKEEPKVEEPKVEEPKVQYVEEILGYSLDEVLGKKATVAKKDKRAAEGIKGQKIEEVTGSKAEKASTLIKDLTSKDTYAKAAGENSELLGFAADEPQVEERAERGDRRERGGPRGRGGNQGARQGVRRVNPKQALRITDDDFPALE